MKKLWNVESFIGKAIEGKKEFDGSSLSTIDKWILSRYSKVLSEVTSHLDEYQFDRAMRAMENFLWHEFADHYIELVKYRIYDKKDEGAQYTLFTIGLGIVKMFATFLPHITEEIYHSYYKDLDGKVSLHLSDWPDLVLEDEDAIAKGELAKDITAALRNWKSEKGLPLNSEVGLVEIAAGDKINLLSDIQNDIVSTIRIKELKVVEKIDIEEKPVAVKPSFAKLGPKFKEKSGEIADILKNADAQEVSLAMEGEGYEITLKNGDKIPISKDFVDFERAYSVHGRKMDTLTVDDIKVLVGN
jgi:valyl-tRNA synthetase